jgi:hypothetical protein
MWDVMRQGDSGDQDRVSTHESRVGALTQVLVMESGPRHKQTYWVEGPPNPELRTNRDLYLQFLKLGRQAKATSWSLSAFLRGLWKVSAPLKDRPTLALDDVAAMFTAASATSPPPYDTAWTTRDLSFPGRGPVGYQDWERVILSQLADLEDFVSFPPGGLARYGVSAPRPPGGGRRCTPDRWLNFDPAAYLECAAAGALGGWRPEDGARVPLPARPGEQPVISKVREVVSVSWPDLARMAACGQLFE